MKLRYFVQPPTRYNVRRYCLLAINGRTVVAVQASRPDGEEVPMPVGVAWARPAERALIGPAPKRLHAAGGADFVQRRALRGCPMCGLVKPRKEFMSPSGVGHPRKFCHTCHDGAKA